MGLVVWLVGSRIGRYLAAVVLGVGIVGLAALWLYNLGRKSERQRQDIEATIGTVAIMAKRIAVDQELSTMPIDIRRRQLREWAEVRERERRLQYPNQTGADG